MTNVKQNPATNRWIRRIGWVASLVLLLALAFGGLKPGLEALRQAIGIRSLLQAGNSLANDELSNPFVCLREGGDASLARAALKNLSDEYLQGVALCLADEGAAGMDALKAAGVESNAEVQYVGGLSAEDAQGGAQALAEGGLAGDDLVAAVRMMSSIPNIDPYPALRMLAKRANKQPETWNLWLTASSRLEMANNWQMALKWLEEGLAMAPPEVQSSMYLHEGWIYQYQIDPRDIQGALAAYNKALVEEGWLSPSDEVTAHLYLGDVYRSLKEENSPEQALAEFQRALELAPGNYWALLGIGHVYLYDLKDIDKAESYYKQALVADDKAPYAYYYFGEVYLGRGNKEAAAEWYRRALERQPDWQPALDRLKSLEDQ